MKKFIYLIICFVCLAPIYSFEIIVRNNIVPSARSAEWSAIIYQNQLIYRTDIEKNTYIFLDMETLSEKILEPKTEICHFIDYLYYEEDNTFYGFYTNKKMSKSFYLSQLKNRRSMGQSKYFIKDFSALPLYGNNKIDSEADEHSAEFECGFPVAYHNGIKYELPRPINDILVQMVNSFMFLSYDLFKLVTFVDTQYHEEKYFEPFICISDVIYDGCVTKETGVYEEPSYESKQVCKINKESVFTVSKSANYEKETEYQDFWYYIFGQDFSGWIRGETLLIEGDTWKDRLALRGEYFTEEDIK